MLRCCLHILAATLLSSLVVQGGVELKRSGNKIKMPDGCDVRLKGVNIPSLEWSNAGENVLASVDVAMDTWKANTIRLPLSQDRWFGYAGQTDGGTGYRNLIASVVSKVAGKGGWVVLDLHWSNLGTFGNNNSQHNMPDKGSTNFWNSVATAYKNNTTVLFDLYNEPHDVTWAVWRNGGSVTESGVTYQTPGMQALLNTVRATGAKNICIAGGLDWAYDLTGITSGYALSDSTGNGVVYAAHIYPWKSDWDGKVTVAASANPIFIGELGHTAETIYESPTTWCPKLLNWIDQNKYHWTGWSFHPTASPAMIKDWTYTPTAYWGQYAKDRLAITSGSDCAPATTSGTGLYAEYFDNSNFTGTKVTRIDSTVNFDWNTNSPIAGIGQDTFSVRWSGQVQPAYSQTYTFYTTTDDGVRLWVNGVQLINKWVDQGAVEWSGTIALTAGQKYNITMEYYDNGGTALAKLSWSSASQAKQIIPQSRLFPIQPGAIYRLTPKIATTRAMEASASGTGDGTQVDIWDWSGGNNQKWKITDVGSGYYKLVPQHATTKALDVSGSGTADGTKIQIWADNASGAQQWKISDMGGGFFKLQPQCAPNSCLDLQYSGTGNGTIIWLYGDNGSDAQRWKLDKQ